MRTKTVFSSDEVAHIWAKQSQSEGRNSAKNIFFVGKDIYSYGYHFCMGRIIDDKTVLLTDRSYSNTTAKHLGQVRYAVNHFENKIYIPYPEKSLSANARAIINRIKTQLDIIGNNRRRQDTKNYAKGQLASIVANVEKFAAATKEKINARWSDKDLQKEFKLYFNAAKSEKATEELSVKLNKLAIAKKKEETVKQLQAIEDWKNGNGVIYIYTSDKVYLREKNNEVETSKGARVSLQAAKILFEMIKAGKDIIGYKIDGYTVLGMNGVLKIGCHEIERTEIERFAKTQNWL